MASNFTPEDNTRVSGIETNVQNNANNIQAVNSYAQGIDNRNFVKYTVNQFVKNGCQIDKVSGELKVSISKGTSTESRYWVEGIMRTIEDGVEASVQANTSGSTRIDSIYVTSDGGLGVQLGIAGSGSAPDVPDNAMKIYELSIPTGTTSDLSGASLIDLRIYYAYTDTLPESGQFVGQYMVSGETIYLWNGTDWVSQNIEIEQRAMTEAEFRADQEQNKSQYAASGFVEWGKHRSNQDHVNTGMWFIQHASFLNRFFLADPKDLIIGDSKTEYATLQIHGTQFDITKFDDPYFSFIIFPPANNTKSERQDFSFPEKWTELISEKDFVYPRGLVQNQASGYKGIYLNTTGAPAASYSAFGAWDTTSPQGRGLRWSTMTQEQKSIFLSDPLNNIRLTEDGLVQDRLRIRTIPAEHNGEWYNTDTSDYLQPEATSYVVAQGSSVSIAADISTNQADGFAGKDQVGTLENGEWYNASKECYAIPICTATRMNQGAYDRDFNPAGSALYSDGQPWQTTTVTRSEANCFIGQIGGNLASGQSGREDGRYHDVIYAKDVRDLRNSSKVQNYTDVLEEMKRKLLNGTMRGWEEEQSYQDNIIGNQIITTNYSKLYFSATKPSWAPSLVEGEIDQNFKGYAIVSNTIYKCTGLIFGGDYWAMLVEGLTTVTAGTPFNLVVTKLNNIQAETLLQCDIIGDPTGANYPSAGFAGVPNLVDVNDPSVSQLPADVPLRPASHDKEFRLSRKAVSRDATYMAIVVYVDILGDGTLTEFTYGSSPDTAFKYSGLVRTNTLWVNWTESGLSDNSIIYAFYETKAYALESDVNNIVLEFEKFIGASYRYIEGDWGAAVNNCLNKVATANTDTPNRVKNLIEYYTVYLLGSLYRKFFTNGTFYQIKHTAMDLLPIGINQPACKFLFYLTKTSSQRLKLQVVFKEMVYDTTWGDNDQFEIVDNVSTQTDDNGNTILYGQKSIPLPYFDNFKN